MKQPKSFPCDRKGCSAIGEDVDKAVRFNKMLLCSQNCKSECKEFRAARRARLGLAN